MNISNQNLADVLLKGNYIVADDLKKFVSFSKNHNISFRDYLIGEGLVSDDLIGQAIAEFLNVPYLDLKSYPVSREQVNLIPEATARKYRVAIFSAEDKKLVLATDSPENKELLPEMKKLFPGTKISLGYALASSIDELFVYYQKSLVTRFSKIIEKKERIAPELLEEIFEDAIAFKASDIHFEPQLKNVVIRFRVDGVLHEAGRIPKEYYENILNRIKVKCGLRIDEHFSAQDGSLRYENNETVVDMRASIVPTVEGEKVVLRVLAAYVQGLNFVDIGLSSKYQEMLSEASKKPFGMILVVGPTGSGKTTTLYVLLKILNNSDSNITTIEDPVEYKIQGINQIQVNTQTNLTFASGLRSIVRQDPDTILVGEVRDNETAEIAINAALTGHLLLSTFHANDAATAVPRLVDMGVEPFLLASTLEVIIAQRLVRKICDNCRYSITLNKSFFDNPKFKPVAEYFKGVKTLYGCKGCESCGHTGYKGRTAIFEFISVTPELQELISKKPSSQEIWKRARLDGSQSLFEDGVLKVKNGVTTIEELLRVAEPPKKI
ncbi:MAG: GspE/PulE family protein [Candidatus Falkowbacteria bacterium]|nr:GspE/PulE family protein [Candidatus Falkowbacteria bacterium]